MRVLVYGAGAVGSLVAARLAAGGLSVTLLARSPHAQAVRQEGLAWTDARGARRRVRVGAVEALGQLDGNFDVVLLACKGYDTDRAAGELSRVLAPEGRVVCVQTGLGHEEAVSARVGAGRVVAAALTASASLEGPGRVVQHTEGGVGLAGWQGAATWDLAAHLRRGGFRVREYGRAVDLKWSKLLLNLVGNATSALLDLPPGEVYADARLFRLERRMLKEAVEVGEASGVRWVDLPGFPVRGLVWLLRLPEAVCGAVLRRAASRGRGRKMPSLWYDVRRGRTEVRFLHGAVADRARAVGREAPVNEALARLVEALASGKEDARRFRGDPDALLREVG